MTYHAPILIDSSQTMLTSKERQALKAKAHKLKPVVMIGNNGLTKEVINETEVSLKKHELIKIKINGAEKAERQQIAQQIADDVEGELVQTLGNIAIIYKENLDD